MDLRTGKVYESHEAAIAAGVPESDLIEVEKRRDDTYWPKRSTNPKHATRHQGARECNRRKPKA